MGVRITRFVRHVTRDNIVMQISIVLEYPSVKQFLDLFEQPRFIFVHYHRESYAWH